MTLSSTTKKVLLLALGPAAIGFLQYLQNSPLNLVTLEHAGIAAAGVALALFLKEEQKVLEGQADAAAQPPVAK